MRRRFNIAFALLMLAWDNSHRDGGATYIKLGAQYKKTVNRYNSYRTRLLNHATSNRNRSRFKWTRRFPQYQPMPF